MINGERNNFSIKNGGIIMKRSIYSLLALVILFSQSYSSNSKSRLSQMVKIERENILERFEQGKSLLAQKFTGQSGESFNKLTEPNAFPDSAIVNLGNGKSEKYKYTYNEDGLLTEERIFFRTDDLIDSGHVSTFEYDENGNETLKLTSTPGTLGLINRERVESEYDANGNMTMRLWQNWSDNNWVNSRRNTREYNTEGKRTVSLNEDWDGTQWVPSARYTNEYDTNGNLINDIIEFENNGMLENWRRSGYTYDSNGNRLTWSNFWWTDGAWEETYRYIYEYDSEHRIISSNYLSTTGSDSLEAKTFTMYSYFPSELKEASVTFDYVDGDLLPSRRSSTDLNTNGDRVYVLNEVYNLDIMDWVNQFQFNFTYNDNSQPTGYVGQFWEESDSTWENAQRHVQEYDMDGNTTYLSFQFWQNDEWVFNFGSLRIEISEDKSLFYFGGEVYLYYESSTTAVDNSNLLPSEFSLEQNYPNPFNPTTTIKYQIAKNKLQINSNDQFQNVTLKIYDILGNEVATLVNENQAPGVYEVNFNAAAFSSGVYFYSIQAGDFVQTKKMILLR